MTFSFALRILLSVLAACCVALASDELTVYELLAPESHSFAITYDMSTSIEGSPYLFNPIRRGSVASNERVIDAATGKALKFETVSAADAVAHGLKSKPNADSYIQVTLTRPVRRVERLGFGFSKPIPMRLHMGQTEAISNFNAVSGSNGTSLFCRKDTSWLNAARRASSRSRVTGESGSVSSTTATMR